MLFFYLDPLVDVLNKIVSAPDEVDRYSIFGKLVSDTLRGMSNSDEAEWEILKILYKK